MQWELYESALDAQVSPKTWSVPVYISVEAEDQEEAWEKVQQDLLNKGVEFDSVDEPEDITEV